MVDFAGAQVVVTGGTGGLLGRAWSSRHCPRFGGAICHVPNMLPAELVDFPYAKDAAVQVVRDVDVADEAAVHRFYQALPPLWASVPPRRRLCDGAGRRDHGRGFHRPIAA